METYDQQNAADPEKIAQQARTAFAQLGHEHGEMSHMATSVREVSYKGHTIRIETSYKITVDGAPVMGHVMVNEAGRVHYHSIPNQEFTSAVDMVKRIIDLTPDGGSAAPPSNMPGMPMPSNPQTPHA